MKMSERIKLRQGSKFISDLEIPDATWKPDYDIADRYQSFANELMRISLLGIAAFGFLIKEVYMKSPQYQVMLKEVAVCVWLGFISLGICVVLALAHRFYSTACLFYQTMIMRSLKRLDNKHWDTAEKETERDFLVMARSAQRKKSDVSHRILVLTAIFFIVGFLLVSIVFYKGLFQFPA
jgi:hypothetical protein